MNLQAQLEAIVTDDYRYYQIELPSIVNGDQEIKFEAQTQKIMKLNKK